MLHLVASLEFLVLVLIALNRDGQLEVGVEEIGSVWIVHAHATSFADLLHLEMFPAHFGRLIDCVADRPGHAWCDLGAWVNQLELELNAWCLFEF